MYATARLVIEPLAQHHAPGLFAALDHPDVHRFLERPDVTTLDALTAKIDRLRSGGYITPGERWRNYVVRLADTTIIGRLEATLYDDRGDGAWAEIAYVFGPRWWHHGYATEASRWLVDHLTSRGIPELWAAVRPANTASQRLLGRLGFTASEPVRMLASFAAGDDTFIRRAGATAAPPR